MPTLTEKETFFKKIDDIVWERDISYLEAVLFYCESTGLEEVVAASLMTPQLKELVEADAANLSLLKGGKSNRLPI